MVATSGRAKSSSVVSIRSAPMSTISSAALAAWTLRHAMAHNSTDTMWRQMPACMAPSGSLLHPHRLFFDFETGQEVAAAGTRHHSAVRIGVPVEADAFARGEACYRYLPI